MTTRTNILALSALVASDEEVADDTVMTTAKTSPTTNPKPDTIAFDDEVRPDDDDDQVDGHEDNLPDRKRQLHANDNTDDTGSFASTLPDASNSSEPAAPATSRRLDEVPPTNRNVTGARYTVNITSLRLE